MYYNEISLNNTLEKQYQQKKVATRKGSHFFSNSKRLDYFT